MANAVLLTNPELSIENVTPVSSTTPLGGRAGKPIAAAGNSGGMDMNARGLSGDTLSHDIVVYGSQEQPFYDPKDDAGVSRYTAPDSTTVATFTDAGTVSLTATTHPAAAVAVVHDQLYLVLADGVPATVKVYRYAGGTSWTLMASRLTGISGALSLSVCAKDGHLRIVVRISTEISILGYEPISGTLATVADPSFSAPGGEGTGLATDGKTIVFLAESTSGTGDVVIYVGSTMRTLVRQPLTITQLFGSSWSASGVKAHAIAHNTARGFVVAVMADTGSDLVPKLITSPDGISWTPFTDYLGVEDQPTFATFTSDNVTLGLALENTRVFLFKGKAASKNGTPTSVMLGWFDGRTMWSVDKDADGGDTVQSTGVISAVFYRGYIYYAYATNTTTIRIRRCNELTTTNTGFRRELRLGEKNYLDGPMDDTRTALSVVPTGEVREGDSWTVPQYYDHSASNILVESLGETYRTADNATPNIVLNMGTGRRHIVDAIAIWGVNVPALNVQFNATDSWGSPSQTFSLSSVRDTLTVASADGDKVTFTTSQWQHDELCIRPTCANLSTGIFRIVANGPNWIRVDGNPGSPSTGAGAATIFGDRMGYFPTEAVYQYARIVYPTALQVPPLLDESGTADAYEIARFLPGSRMDLTKNYGVTFKKTVSQPTSEIALRGSRRVPVSVNDTQPDEWELFIPPDNYSVTLAALRAFYKRTQGAVRQFVFWPEGSAEPNNFEICRFNGDLVFTHVDLYYQSETFRIRSEVP